MALWMLAVCLACFFLAGDAQSNLGLQRSAADANTDFLFDLLAALNQARMNIFFSPYSISSMFAMLYLGSRSKTASELSTAFSFNRIGDGNSSVFYAYQQLINQYSNQKSGDVHTGADVNVANGLFESANSTALPGFRNDLRWFFGADMQQVDFNQRVEAAKTINDYVRQKTRGRITEMVSPDSLGADTNLVLLNAIYFKGTWKYAFSKEHTQKDTFTALGNQLTNIPFMHLTNSFGYYEDTDDLQAQVIELPYTHNGISMFVILPSENEGILQLLPKLNSVSLRRLRSRMTTTEVRVAFPRFKLDARFSLPSTMKKMGVNTLFDHRADLSGIDGTRNLRVGTALHKANLEVDETGTVASASTAAIIVNKSFVESTSFLANHPFVFFIEDTSTGMVLFFGVFQGPTTKTS